MTKVSKWEGTTRDGWGCQEAEKKEQREAVGCGVVRERGVGKDWDGSHNRSRRPMLQEETPTDGGSRDSEK